MDEVSSVSRKRLIPGVTTEAALVLAYHRFYGRPVPPDFRDLIHMVDRSAPAPAPYPIRRKRSDSAFVFGAREEAPLGLED